MQIFSSDVVAIPEIAQRVFMLETGWNATFVGYLQPRPCERCYGSLAIHP
jgi:hypothetical protein